MGNEQSAQKKRQKANPEKKVHNGELNGHAVPTPDQTEPVAKKEAPVEQKSEAPPVAVKEEPKPPEKEEVDNSKANKPAHVETTPEKKITVATDSEPPKKAPKSSGDETPNFFGKMFKKKPEPVKPASEKNDTVDAPVTVLELKIDAQPDPVDIKISTEPEPEPKAEALEPSPVQTTEENNLSEEAKAAEKTVMNFFKTFVPTKTSKEAKAAADVSKEQSQKETPPAPSTNEAPKAPPPPPPPPAPPKMESKAEPAVKKEETSASKAAVKAEPSAKSKTKDGAFSKLFRSKPVEVEEKKPVEVQQVDSSKSSTLEAAAKPEEPPAPKPEEKKLEKKSTFGNMFKPKVLLGQVSSRIQAVASSARVSLMSAGAASESKKETAAPAPVAEAAPPVKAKEEPKPAAPSAPQPAQDNKSVASTDASPNMPRKLEKRNSLQLFFKNLGQKRHSDAGVQTEPVAPEKAK
ncbi:breast carcinoma-amplified sequence 1 isoform X2 [Danio aesculapii]|uniref:breast carcinoma-amplified sequence 1 isoform X2 n=1 Tax=Danio aesculapii TaxID=1142201 RepID=UPI0024BF15C9|nr:breast carcinoma-amplified sequence 1 isoform X2 [Danio aesculapii]